MIAALAVPAAAAPPTGAWAGPGSATATFSDGSSCTSDALVELVIDEALDTVRLVVETVDPLCDTFTDSFQLSTDCGTENGTLNCTYAGTTASALLLSSSGDLAYAHADTSGFHDEVRAQLRHVPYTEQLP